MLYDNDGANDVYTDEYLLALNSIGEIRLVGLMTSSSITPDNNYVTPANFEEFVAERNQIGLYAQASGFVRVPPRVRGPIGQLRPPASQQIEATQPIGSVGSWLIVTEARKATAAKPLVVVVGGPLTAEADAYLLDPTIADKMVIAWIGGRSSDMGDYNGWCDPWASYIAMRRLRLIQFTSYVGRPFVAKSDLLSLPASPLRNYMYAKQHPTNSDPGNYDTDGPPAISLTRPDYPLTIKRVSFNGWVSVPVDVFHSVPAFRDDALGTMLVVSENNANVGGSEWWRVMRAACAQNTTPTISNLADRTISRGGSTGAIAFTVDDAQTAAGSLLVAGGSSNTTLVPVANIVFGGSTANRTVTVTPVSSQTGSATISVSVSDGLLTSTDTFVLTVNDVVSNTAPTISSFIDRTINQGGNTGAITFTVGDGQTAAGSLSVVGSSSNTALVPSGNIVFGGSGANRTVTVTPVANQSGAATVTVSVSDGALSATRSFTLSVTASNNLPTISSIADLTIPRGTSTGPMSFTVGDIETPAASLVLSATSSNALLVPVGNVTFGGSGANRTVTIVPVVTQSGAAAITVNVSDGAAVVGRAFNLIVSSVNQPLTAVDIGGPALSGSTSLTNGVYVIRAGGDDIWFQRDQFHFASEQLAGNAEIIVRVASLTQAHVWTKAGVMFRGALTADAPFVAVFVTPENGVNLQWRTQPGANARSGTALLRFAPEWLKLVRTGDSFYASCSEDGANWQLVEAVNVDLPDVAFGGLAVTSHNTLTPTTATFENFAID